MHRRLFLKILGTTGAAVALADIGRAATTHQVTIEGFRFNPASLAVSPGDTVVFTNQDNAPHTATASDRSWDLGRMQPGQSAELTVTANMQGSYFCAVHPSMKGELTGI